MNESVQEYEYDDRLTVFPTFFLFFFPTAPLFFIFPPPSIHDICIYIRATVLKSGTVHTVGGKGTSGGFFFLSFFFFFIRPFPSSISQVKCTAISVPKADSVVWSFAGREFNLSTNNTQFSVQEEYTAERVVSTVTLLEPTSTYFGDYNCTVTNSFGTDSVIIKLTAHSKFISIITGRPFSFFFSLSFITLSIFIFLSISLSLSLSLSLSFYLSLSFSPFLSFSLRLASCLHSSLPRFHAIFRVLRATRPRKIATFSGWKNARSDSRDLPGRGITSLLPGRGKRKKEKKESVIWTESITKSAVT